MANLLIRIIFILTIKGCLCNGCDIAPRCSKIKLPGSGDAVSLVPKRVTSRKGHPIMKLNGMDALVCSFPDCLSNPCSSGQCVETEVGFYCVCLATDAGERCEKVIFTTDTTYRYRYSFPDVTAEKVQNLQISFTVKASNDVCISLAPDRDPEVLYRIAIGNYRNTKSTIRRCKTCLTTQVTARGARLSPTEARSFTVLYHNGRIAVFAGEDMEQSFMEWVDSNPLNVTQFGYSTGWGSTGEFIFEKCSPNC